MQRTELDLLLKQSQYDGMPKPESDITRAWLRQYGLAYDRFEFNVRLGQGRPPDPSLTETTQRQNALLSQLRADIVGYIDGRVDMIEVKFRGDARAMGQVFGYAHLWSEDNPTVAVRNLIIVARIIDPDIRRIYEANNITFFTIEPEGVLI